MIKLHFSVSKFVHAFTHLLWNVDVWPY